MLDTVELEAVHRLIDSKDPSAWTASGNLLKEHCGDWRAIMMAGYAALKQDQHGVALILLREANRINPNCSEVLNNIGLCCLGINDHAGAKVALKEALRIKPDNWQAMSNLSLAYVQTAEPGMGIHWADKALALQEDSAAQEMKGYAHLMLRQWEQGWKGYEGALEGKVRVPRPYGRAPYWDGKPVDTLLVCGEQGIGDEISFASMLGDVQGVKNLIVECDHRLEGLLARSFPHAQVVGSRWHTEARGLFHMEPDAHCLIGSLGQYTRASDESFHGRPYLVADPERRLQWRALLDTLPGKKVGIAWRGGRHHTHGAMRSLTLPDLKPILDVPGVTFVSLEYKAPDLTGFEHIRHWHRAVQSPDYDDTAALVAELDLVISVQTSVVHLAGGLGVPCWALIPRKPLWRYGLEGEAFPWANSVRLFRQQKDWPIPEVATLLKRLSGT